jgi:hypothetical protein
MENKTLQEKLNYSNKLLSKYPDRVPTIIEKCEINLKLQNHRYLLPKQMLMRDFIAIIRTKTNITEKNAIFTFVKSTDGYVLVPMSETVENMYLLHKSQDNFLYIKLGIENTFG